MGISIRRRLLTGKNTGQSMRSAMQMFWMRWQPRRTLQDALAGACLITTLTRISEVVTASVITESWICSAIRNWQRRSILVRRRKEPVLELSSSMDIGEHPGCNRGETYIFTNADKVRMYKNDRFIKEYSAADSPYTHLKHGPILIDDFIGDALQEEHMKPGQEAGVKKALNAFTRFGFAKLPKSIYATGIWLILRYHMNMEEAVRLYNQYIGDWGGTSTTYRFEAVMVDASTRQERVVKTIIKEPMTERKISAVADHENLIDAESYDVAEVRIQAQDEHGNILPFYNEPLTFETEGPIEIIGPKTVALQGGMGGAYVKSKRLQPGEKQNAALIIRDCDTEIKIGFTVQSERNF